jgi:DNA-binding transcriptional ArsR family regulator
LVRPLGSEAFMGFGNVALPRDLHKLSSTLHFMDRAPTPSLLPIFRSQQQAELLALLLGDPQLELSVSDLASQQSTPYASVHREIERAEAAGLVTSRKVGNTRLVRANSESPYFEGLAQVLTRAFGVPAVLAAALRPVDGITGAFVCGSWAARYLGTAGQRPVEDIDVLVLGGPDRDELYAAIEEVEPRLGRPVQVTIRHASWLEDGHGSFHDTVLSRPMVPVPMDEAVPPVA